MLSTDKWLNKVTKTSGLLERISINLIPTKRKTTKSFNFNTREFKKNFKQN